MRHRGPHEVEMFVSRPAEDPHWIDEQLAGLERSAVDIDTLLYAQRARYEAALQHLRIAASRKFDSFQARLQEAARLTRLREAGRSEVVRTFWVSRVFVLRAGGLCGLGEDAFFLEDRGLNLALGEMSLRVSEQGDGWGWQATAGSPCLTTLIFQFTPPLAGNILVDAYVDFKGQFALSAHDHWYTSTRADITLSVSSRLYQHYWEFGPGETLIDEHRTDSSNSGWIDRLVKLSYSTSVSANDRC